MIKCRINSLVLVLFLLLAPCLVFALPGPHDPATGGNGFLCNDCHVSPASFGDTAANFTTNVCLRCHGVSKRKTNKAFFPEDFADIDNTNAALRGTAYNTSHKWLGTAINSNAKAVAAVDPNTTQGLNKAMIKGAGTGGTLSCVRCHSVHGTAGTQSNTSPYLRYVNDKDQLCMNCHLPRKNSTTALGSHPVNVTYTSARVKAKASEYYGTSPRAYQTNPTAQLKLVSGNVVCSSCHKVHVADSDSATMDNYSTSNGFSGGLNPSDGSLLRISKRGANATQAVTNICTNCHVKNHSGQAYQHTSKQDIQCVDCHGAHVDATDPKGGSVNQYLLRRYVNYSGVKNGVVKLTGANAYRRRVLYTSYTSVGGVPTAKWAASDNTGVCQACHLLPTTITDHASNTLASKTRRDCISCHANAPHSDTRPGGGCSSCHGNPPVDAATTAQINTPAYTGTEATAPHSTHASGGTKYSYGCYQCHNGSNGTGATHNNGTYNDGVFVTKVAVAPAGVIAGPSATYTTGTTVCSNVYCHSDGTSTTSFGSPKTVTWAAGLGTITTCDACHDATPSTGSHTKHAATMNYGCKNCHATAVSDNSTISDKTVHVNAVKDVSFYNTVPALATGSYTSTPKTCTTACHSNGKGVAAITTPVWGTSSTGACNTCHLTGSSSPQLASNAHAKHFTAFSSAYTGQVRANTVCSVCHVYTLETATTHVNGTVSMIGTCTPCHLAVPVWTSNNPGNMDCSSVCHPTLSASHAAHVGSSPFTTVNGYGTAYANYTGNKSDSSGYRFGCSKCHPTVNASHGNGNIVLNASNGQTGTTKVSKTCAASACHSDGKGSYTTSPNWYTGYVGPDKCAMCHLATPATGSHSAHTTNGIHDGETGVSYSAAYSCAKCHASTVDGSKNITYANHVNGNVNVAFVAATETSKAQISAGSFNAYSTVWTRTGSVDVSKKLLSTGGYAGSGGTCSTVVCHNNGTTPRWDIATTPKISCVDCHSTL